MRGSGPAIIAGSANGVRRSERFVFSVGFRSLNRKKTVDGKVDTVRYDAVDAMLLNEFLKEHRTVEELKKEIAALTVTVKEQRKCRK